MSEQTMTRPIKGITIEIDGSRNARALNIAPEDNQSSDELKMRFMRKRFRGVLGVGRNHTNGCVRIGLSAEHRSRKPDGVEVEPFDIDSSVFTFMDDDALELYIRSRILSYNGVLIVGSELVPYGFNVVREARKAQTQPPSDLKDTKDSKDIKGVTIEIEGGDKGRDVIMKAKALGLEIITPELIESNPSLRDATPLDSRDRRDFDFLYRTTGSTRIYSYDYIASHSIKELRVLLSGGRIDRDETK